MKKKLTEDFFPSFENMKIIFTYIMFTFFKTGNNKKKHLVSLLGNIFFGLQYFCVDMINKRKTVGCYGLDTAIKVHLVERKHNI